LGRDTRYDKQKETLIKWRVATREAGGSIKPGAWAPGRHLRCFSSPR